MASPLQFNDLVSSAMEVMFSSMFGCGLVCQHKYRKNIERISMKLGWRTGLGPESSPVTFSADKDDRADPGFHITVSEIECSFTILLICQGTVHRF